MKKLKIRKLILSGGGIKGIAICGAIEKLDDEINLLKYVKTVIGTSIGAYIAFFLAIGLSLRKIKVIFENINFEEYQEFDFKLLLSKYGLDEGNKLLSLVKATITTQNLNPCITFKELAEKSKYDLIIVGTNVNTSRAVYFSAKDTPEMSICTALRISGGYPFAFTPVEINGDLYADGGIVSPIASELITKKERNKTLAIVLHRGFSRYKTDNIQLYSFGVISCMIDSLVDSKLANLKHYIIISYPLNSLELGIDKEEKNKMMDFGREKAKAWIDNFNS